MRTIAVERSSEERSSTDCSVVTRSWSTSVPLIAKRMGGSVSLASPRYAMRTTAVERSSSEIPSRDWSLLTNFGSACVPLIMNTTAGIGSFWGPSYSMRITVVERSSNERCESACKRLTHRATLPKLRLNNEARRITVFCSSVRSILVLSVKQKKRGATNGFNSAAYSRAWRGQNLRRLHRLSVSPAWSCNRAFRAPSTQSHQLRHFALCIRSCFAKETLSLFRRTFSRAGCTGRLFYSYRARRFRGCGGFS